MTESELVNEIASRARVSPADAERMLDALAAVAREQARSGQAVPIEPFAHEKGPAGPCTGAFTPGEEDVEALIRAASHNPLGLEFLLEGQLCAVAITFQVHAFTVEAARQRLKEQGAWTA